MTLTALADVPTVLEGWTPRDPVDADAILANVRDILPIVDAEAATTSAQGFMTTRMGEALRQAGVYRVGFASWRGGPQLTLTQQTRMVEMIAARDAS
ncbi:MAG: hypothetical protein DI573_13370, partial [Microbacterium sp.]|uniref:hypothetical protein n=1 Tax=Microbacterium sp. TaxID=51671 RepID=UPI000DAFED86